MPMPHPPAGVPPTADGAAPPSVRRRTGSFTAEDLDGLWSDDVRDAQTRPEPAPSDELVAEVEELLGYRLPDAYVELCRLHNGGGLRRGCFPVEAPTSWAEDHVAVSRIAPIGMSLEDSLAGESGSRFMIEQWGYPQIGVVFGACPSAGHDVVMLDYSECGPGASRAWSTSTRSATTAQPCSPPTSRPSSGDCLPPRPLRPPDGRQRPPRRSPRRPRRRRVCRPPRRGRRLSAPQAGALRQDREGERPG